jgi:hypothetical protein
VELTDAEIAAAADIPTITTLAALPALLELP